jgi:hypothetical protein
MEATIFTGIQVAGKSDFYQIGIGVASAVTNPLTGESVTAQHRRIKTDLHLPAKDDYSDFCGHWCRRMA